MAFVLLLSITTRTVWADGTVLQGNVQTRQPLAGRAGQATPNQRASASKPYIRLDGTGFYYTTDFEARYLAEKQRWRDANASRVPTLTDLVMMARRAYVPPKGQSVERPLTHWHIREDPSPWIFRPKVLLVNTSPDVTELDLTIEAKVEVKVGEWLVHPDTMLADLSHLASSGKWTPVSSKTVKVPVLAAHDEMLVPLPPIEVLSLFASQANRWPALIRLTATVSPQGVPVTDRPRLSVELPLTPDHMALPLYLY